MRACTIPGCIKRHEARGWCDMHYARWKRLGDPLAKIIADDGNAINSQGYKIYAGKKEHTEIAERVLGKRLPKNVIVHHADENRANNDHGNLVICTRGFHQVIHARMRALAASGNPNWRICKYCGQYDDPSRMYISPLHAHAWHRECARKVKATRRAK